MVTICRNNEDDTMTFFGCTRNSAPRTDAFIIRMGMKTNEGSHYACFAAPLASKASMFETPQSRKMSAVCWPA